MTVENLSNGKSIEQVPIHLRSKEGLGYLPQQRSVFDMSVYDNIMGIAQLSIKGLENQKAIRTDSKRILISSICDNKCKRYLERG